MATLSWVGGSINSTPGGTTRRMSLANFGDDVNGLSSTNVQAALPSAAGTYSLMSIFVSANGGNTSTVVFNVNSVAGNQTVSIGSGATGWFQDATHSDTVSEGDKVNLEMTTGSGITYKGVYSCMFSVAGSGAITYMGQGGGMMSTDFSGGNLDYFWGGHAGQSGTTELATKLTIRAAGAFTKLSILGNTAAQVPHIRSRLNGADGVLDIAQGTGTDGVLQTDSTHTDTVASGDTWGFRTSTSGSRRWANVSARFTSSDTKFDLVSGPGSSTLGSGTHYLPIMGEQPATQETTEANANAKAPAAVTLSKLRVTVGTNGLVGGSQVYTLRKNANPGNNTITVPVTTTGLFEDTSNTDSIAAGDLVCVQCVGSNSSGSVQAIMGILADMATSLTETGTVDLEFSGISLDGTGYTAEVGSGDLEFFGIELDASGDRGERGAIDLEFSGIELDATGDFEEDGTISLSFQGISLAAAGVKIDEIGTIDLEFSGVELASAGIVAAAAGTGVRQFWTFGN